MRARARGPGSFQPPRPGSLFCASISPTGLLVASAEARRVRGQLSLRFPLFKKMYLFIFIFCTMESYLFKNFIVELLYNAVLVSGVQQSDSVMHIHVHNLLRSLFPYGLLQTGDRCAPASASVSFQVAPSLRQGPTGLTGWPAEGP